MRYLYTALLYLMTPFIVLRLYWKSMRLSAYRQRIGERFSCHAVVPVDVWVHAVSLGEVVAATPLIQALLERGLRVMVTTMTPTGSQQVVSRFGSRVSHQYVPYDLPWVVRRFFKAMNPRLGIIMETELWPNLIFEANQLKIPLLLVNARLSDKAFKQYEKVRFIFKPILNQLTRILAQSEEDARRFVALGAAPWRVHAVGNLKFDMPPVVIDPALSSVFSNAWGKDRVVVIAASTHDNEEEQLLSRLSILQRAIPHVLLLIAPRHPERFQAVYQLCQQHQFKTGLRSTPETIHSDSEVIVLDSLGELALFYALSDYAFVGGSLVPIGGHNVLEAIAVNVPVFCGPYMNNAQSICDALCEADAIEQAENADELIQKMITLYNNPLRCEQLKKHALAVLQANQGTLLRCMEEVLLILGQSVDIRSHCI